MNLSWSFLVLALIAADDQQPSSPIAPKSPPSIRIPARPTGSDLAGCAPALSCDDASKCPSLGSGPHERCAILQQICANLYPESMRAELANVAGSKTAGCPVERSESKEKIAIALLNDMSRVARPRTMSDAEAQEVWPMSLRDATRIALDNSEVVRVISSVNSRPPAGSTMPTSLKIGPKVEPIVIARLNADASVWRFKAEVMAQLRSVEQQYWNLTQAHVQLWSADRAVSLAQEILNREQAELLVGRGTVADVAEAAQRLEQFKLDLVTRTSDVITTERQLRNLLGLPPADNRRIVPVTPSTEAKVEPDWDSSLAEMLESQPDVAQQKLLVHAAELQLLAARCAAASDPSPAAERHLDALAQPPESAKAGTSWEIGGTFQMPLGMRYPLANARSAQYVLLRSRAYLQQVVHQTTHSLARFFLEIDANYKQLQTAKRLRMAAAQRLDAQRAYYEEGRITIDRFLDAVSQYTTAVATEAQYKATYNISLVALEETKGTLLAYENVVIAEKPPTVTLTDARPVRAVEAGDRPGKADERVVTASFAQDKPPESEVPPAGGQGKTPTPSAPAAAKSKTWSFSIAIGGANPLRITGTLTATDGETTAAAR